MTRACIPYCACLIRCGARGRARIRISNECLLAPPHVYSFSYRRLLARLPHINPTSQRATREANGRLAHIQRWRPRCRRAHASPRASSSGARASTPRPERGSRDAPVPLGSAYQQPAANSRSPPTTRGRESRPGRRATPTPWIQTAGISRASLPHLRHAHGEQRRTLAPTPSSVWRAARASSCGAELGCRVIAMRRR